MLVQHFLKNIENVDSIFLRNIGPTFPKNILKNVSQTSQPIRVEEIDVNFHSEFISPISHRVSHFSGCPHPKECPKRGW
jgi:hypothetical protein